MAPTEPKSQHHGANINPQDSCGKLKSKMLRITNLIGGDVGLKANTSDTNLIIYSVYWTLYEVN